MLICLLFWEQLPINCEENSLKPNNTFDFIPEFCSFCPALSVLSEVMGLSENIAGVTILAFGNGSPDIFTALANYDGDSELIYAELLGTNHCSYIHN